MFRFIQLMLCLLASVSAFEMPMSRRGLMSKVAAAAPLAAVLPAFADADNRMYTLVARPAVEQISGAAPTKAVGTAITVDEVWGSAPGAGKVLTPKQAAAYSKDSRGVKVRTHTALHHFLYSFPRVASCVAALLTALTPPNRPFFSPADAGGGPQQGHGAPHGQVSALPGRPRTWL